MYVSKTIFKKIGLAWFKFRPFSSFNPLILIRSLSLGKDQPRKFSPTSKVEVDQLVIFACHDFFAISKCKKRSKRFKV